MTATSESGLYPATSSEVDRRLALAQAKIDLARKRIDAGLKKSGLALLDEAQRIIDGLPK